MAKRNYEKAFDPKAGFADFANPDQEHALADLALAHPLIARYLARRHAPGTLDKYAWVQRIFREWCDDNNRVAVPASIDTLLAFMDDQKHRWGPKARYVAITAIGHLHLEHGCSFNSRWIRSLLKNIHGREAQMPRQAAALDTETLRDVTTAIPRTAVGCRDRALILLGFAAALRPYEIVGLDLGVRSADGVGTITFVPEGMRIRLHRTKVDQGERGIEKLVIEGCEPCPVQAVKEWLKLSGITRGVVLPRMRCNGVLTDERLSPSAVSRIVRARAIETFIQQGLTPAEAGCRGAAISGYSLRVGFVTSAVRANVNADDITSHVGWADSRMLLRYARQPEGGDPELVSQVFGRG